MDKSQEKLRQIIAKLPDTPGVYRFIGPKKNVLYVGKATSLRSRVRSYFTPNIGEKRSPLIAKMMSEVADVVFEKTDSVLEALILESYLIKKLEPPFNSADKDQKSFNYVVITLEDFPRVLLIRERNLKAENFKIKHLFGPFPHGNELKEALKIVRKIFPFRDKCSPGSEGVGCFNYQLGLCPGICIGAISKKEYAQTIGHLKTFFEGNKKKLIKNLEKEMKSLAKAREFEKASEIKRKVFALKHIQDIALIKRSKVQTVDSQFETFRIEAYDVAHISGTNMVGVMVVVASSEAQKSDYRMFKIRGQKDADDTKALKEILERRLKHTEWPYPDLIVVDGGLAQLNAAENTLKDLKIEGLKNIEVVAVTKDSKHKPVEIQISNSKFQKLAEKYEKEILLANSEAHRFALKFHRKLRDSLK